MEGTGEIVSGERRRTILAIDPGEKVSGVVTFDIESGRVNFSDVMENYDVLKLVAVSHFHEIAIEMIASYGMPVGREVFETCVWIGRFIQESPDPAGVRLVYRKDVKSTLCGSAKAKDGNIRQALIDRLGKPGTKKDPGNTYGVKSHAWAALAVAVVAAEES